tara:strand:+ start:1209 stop:2489 length:1281 start_codon:yes stop_codon:yes gene_type:complete
MRTNFCIIRLLSSIVGLCLLNAAEAGSALWTYTPLTETTITVASNETATIQYTVTNQSMVPHTLEMTPIPGISQTTTAGHCASSFTLGYHESCTLTLVVTGSALSGNVSGGPKTCEQGNSLQCYQPNLEDLLNITLAPSFNNFAYLAQPSGISVCSVLSNSEFGACTLNTNEIFNIPGDIVLNKAGTRAYVLNTGDDSVINCEVDSVTGQIQTCVKETNPSADFNYGGLNPGGTFLYLSSYDNNLIYICPIMSDGGLGTCSTSNGGGTFDGPNGRIGFNPGGSNAYIPIYNNDSVSICNVDTLTGDFSACSTSSGFGTINSPLGADLNDNGTILYVANDDNSISICTISSVDGTLTACSSSDGNATFDFYGDAINPFASNNSYLYVPNDRNSTVSKCPIIDNTLGTCTVISRQSIDGALSVWLSAG